MESPMWIREAKEDEPESTAFLLGLYKVYQDRLLSDLRLLFSYTNFYAAALMALFGAFVVALVKTKDEPMAALLTLLPFAAHVWIWIGRVTAWTYYRRYTEGRMLLLKIEYALGLDRQIPVTGFKGQAPFMWAAEECFLPERYFKDARKYETSADFSLGISLNYGLGKLTQLMFTAFLIFAWVGLFVTPVCLWLFREPDSAIGFAFWSSVIMSVIASVCAGIVQCFYKKVWKDMQR